MARDGGPGEFHDGDNYCKPIETTVIQLSMVGRLLNPGNLTKNTTVWKRQLSSNMAILAIYLH